MLNNIGKTSPKQIIYKYLTYNMKFHLNHFLLFFFFVLVVSWSKCMYTYIHMLQSCASIISPDCIHRCICTLNCHMQHACVLDVNVLGTSTGYVHIPVYPD